MTDPNYLRIITDVRSALQPVKGSGEGQGGEGEEEEEEEEGGGKGGEETWKDWRKEAARSAKTSNPCRHASAAACTTVLAAAAIAAQLYMNGASIL